MTVSGACHYSMCKIMRSEDGVLRNFGSVEKTYYAVLMGIQMLWEPSFMYDIFA